MQSSTPKTEAEVSFKTLIPTYQIALCHNHKSIQILSA